MHRSKSIGHDIKIVSDRLRPDPITRIRRRMAEASLHDHSVSVPRLAVARRAEYVEPLLAANENGAGERKRQRVHKLIATFPRIKSLIRVQLSACDCSFHIGSGGPVVRKERASLLEACNEADHAYPVGIRKVPARRRPLPLAFYLGTLDTSIGLWFSRNTRVFSESNSGSSD